MVILICLLSLVKSSIILVSIVYSSLDHGIVANLLDTFSDYVIYACTTPNFLLLFDQNFNQFFMENMVFSFKRSGTRREAVIDTSKQMWMLF
jgi:hypothetical protein